MTASRRLINLAGTLLVVIVLVAGTMLTALPIYIESLKLNAQEREVAASNQLLQTQIDALSAKEAELPQVEQDLAELHAQLPGIPQLDDAVQLVVRAAGKADAAIESVQFDDFAPFVVRDAAMVADQLPKNATGVAPAVQPEDEGTDQNGSGDAVATDDPASDPTSDTGPTTDSEPAAPGNDGQLQFPVRIDVTVPDPVAASRFLDELRAGPRLLRIDVVTASTDENNSVKLLVTGFVFASLS